MIWYLYFSLRGSVAFDIYDEELWKFSSLVADISAIGVHSAGENKKKKKKSFLKWHIHVRNTKGKTYFAWYIFSKQTNAYALDVPSLDNL